MLPSRRSFVLPPPPESFTVPRLAPPPPPSTLEPPAWAEVALSVYELNGARALNAVTERVGLGGAYHVGIEVYWLEWSYGWSFRGTGVHVVPVGQSKIGKFKERISLGKTPLPPHEVFAVLAQLRRQWAGQDYHYLRQNCGHFCAELAMRLRVPGEIPGWVTSLAETGDWLAQMLGVQDGSEDCGPSSQEEVTPRTVLELLRHDPAVAKSELEWQWAQEHTFWKAQRASQQEQHHQLMRGAANANVLNQWAPHSYSLMTGL
uniref:PPPDE domain-containing protein n=1 Tax=Zooxanthella nutricula TaxID=1333877 RepID=A0A7S2I796_9DINO